MQLSTTFGRHDRQPSPPDCVHWAALLCFCCPTNASHCCSMVATALKSVDWPLACHGSSRLCALPDEPQNNHLHAFSLVDSVRCNAICKFIHWCVIVIGALYHHYHLQIKLRFSVLALLFGSKLVSVRMDFTYTSSGTLLRFTSYVGLLWLMLLCNSKAKINPEGMKEQLNSIEPLIALIWYRA